MALAGCAARAKPQLPAAPAPPVPQAQPLSVPQTQVELPRPQPFNPDALATAPPVTGPPPAAPPANPQPPQRRPAGPATPPGPKPDSPPTETARPPIQEIVPAAVQQQLQRSAQDHRQQVGQLLAQAQRGKLSVSQQNLVKRINQFVKLSIDAEKAGDMRSADELANRAYILAKELQSGN